MTTKRILELAWEQALAIWVQEHDFLERHPENEIAQVQERKAWIEQSELHRLLLDSKE